MQKIVRTMATTKHKRRLTIGRVLKGDPSISHWVWKRRRFIAFCMLLLLLYITHSNAVRTAARQQQKLRDTLVSAKAEAMAVSAELLRITSLPEIKKELRRRNSSLHEADSPPIILTIRKND